jgi:hypothetical protein
MSATSLNQIAGLSSLLRSLRRRVWISSVTRGLAETTAVAIACILAGVTIDFLLPLPAMVRLGLLVVVSAATLTIAWRSLLNPLLKNLPDEEIAAAVDLSFPELQESLATLLSVEPGSQQTGDPGSKLMRRHLVERVAGRLRSVNPGRVVHHGSTLRQLGFATSVAVLLLIPTLIWPSAMTQLVQRLVTPFANTGTVSNLYFEIPEGNRIVAIGSDVEFAAIPKWRSAEPGICPEGVTVELKAENGLDDVLSMSFDELNSQFVCVLPAIQQGFEYRVVGGGAQSEWFHLQAAEAPQISGANLTATPPVYCRRPVRICDGAVGEMSVFERSDVEVIVQFNKPVESATLNWIEWQPITSQVAVDEFPEDVAVASDVNRDNPIVVEPVLFSPDGLSAVFQFTALGSGRFEFLAIDALGLSNSGEPERVFQVVEDTPPELTVSGVQDGLSLRSSDVIPLDCVVNDDIGVDTLDLYYRKNEEAERILPAAGFERGARDVAWSFRLALDSLDVTTGDTVLVRVRTADERPVPEANVVWKGPWTIRIDEQADAIGTKALSDEDQLMIDQLKEVEKQLDQDAGTARELKNRVWQKWDDEARKNTQLLSEKEQQQGRQLQQLAQQVAQHPLMQNQAEAVKQIGEHVATQIPKPLNAAADAQRTDAANELQDAVTQLDSARQQLRQSIEQIEKIAQIEQELAELNRLALDAEQLATAAQEHQQQKESGQPEEGQAPEEFQDQLQQEGEQLEGKRQQLQQDLDQLLQRQEELLESAQRSQQEQLSELSEQARRLSQQEHQVSEGVNEEARDASRESRPLVDELQQVRNDVQKLDRDTTKVAPDVDSPKAAPLDDAMRELRKGNLAEPQQQIDGVRNDLEQAAKQLNQQPSGGEQPQQNNAQEGNPPNAEKPQDADPQREALAERSRELASQLQQINDKLAQQTQQRGGERQQQPDQQRPDQQQQPDQQQPSSVTNELVDRLEELAESGQQLADAVQAQDGVPGGAVGQAKEMAQQGQNASGAAQAGQFNRAADRMRKAANAAKAAAEKLKNEQQSDRQNQLEGLGEEYSRLANTVQQMQQDNAAQAGIQQRSQQRIAQEASQLPERLGEIAERMELPALGMEPQARLAQEAKHAATQASESGQQASQQLQQAQLQQAAESGQKTSGELNRVAQLAQQAGRPQQGGPPLIPSEVGENVAEAMQSLQRAGEQLGQQPAESNQQGSEGSQSSEAAGQSANGEPSASGESGESGQPGQDGQPSSAGDEASSESNQPGEGSPSSQGKPAPGQPGSGSPSQQLSDAAQALADAARDSLPQQFTPGKLSDGGSSSGESAMGNDAEFDGRNVARSQFSSRLRDWGRLQDELSGDMKNDGPEVIDIEYSDLIRRYRRELARAVAGDSAADAGNE